MKWVKTCKITGMVVWLSVRRVNLICLLVVELIHWQLSTHGGRKQVNQFIYICHDPASVRAISTPNNTLAFYNKTSLKSYLLKIKPWLLTVRSLEVSLFGNNKWKQTKEKQLNWFLLTVACVAGLRGYSTNLDTSGGNVSFLLMSYQWWLKGPIHLNYKKEPCK